MAQKNILILICLHTLSVYSEPIQNADGFIPDCHEAFPNQVVRDPEFNQDEFLAVWRMDPKLGQEGIIKTPGSVWITLIDPLTGDFLLDGQTQISEANPVPQGGVPNGPD